MSVRNETLSFTSAAFRGTHATEIFRSATLRFRNATESFKVTA